MKKILLSSLLVLSAFSFAQSYSGPESVEYDYANNRWLIANTTSHLVLARNNATGALTTLASGMTSGPYGIEIVGDTLYCCCGSTVKGFLLSTGANVFNVNVGATFLNGMTHDNAGNLYATDFSAKKVFKINISTQAFSAVASSLVQSPNGIIFDQYRNRCIFINWGSNAPFKAMDLTTYAVTVAKTTTHTNIDGIARDGAGNYYVSVWGTNSIYKYDSAFVNAPVLVASGMSSPADIFYNTVSDTLAIPNSGNNTVVFLGFTPTVSIQEQAWLTSINVFPNPATERVTINFLLKNESSVIIDLINIEGKVIKNVFISQSKMLNGQVDLTSSGLSAGVYFVRMQAGEYSKSIPILLKSAK